MSRELWLRARNAVRRFVCHRLCGGHRMDPLTIEGPQRYELVETVIIWTCCRGFCRQSFAISATMSLDEQRWSRASINELWAFKCDRAVDQIRAALPGYELACGPMPWRGQR